MFVHFIYHFLCLLLKKETIKHKKYNYKKKKKERKLHRLFGKRRARHHYH